MSPDCTMLTRSGAQFPLRDLDNEFHGQALAASPWGVGQLARLGKAGPVRQNSRAVRRYFPILPASPARVEATVLRLQSRLIGASIATPYREPDGCPGLRSISAERSKGKPGDTRALAPSANAPPRTLLSKGGQ